MSTSKPQTQPFDFSLDALCFKKQLAKRLLEAAARSVQLEDDDLEFVNAAGVPQHVPADDELL